MRLKMVKLLSKKIFLQNIFYFLFSTIILAQSSYNLSQFKNETLDFIKQPTKWQNEDWLKVGLIGAGTFLAMQFDQSIRDEVMKDRSYYKSFPIEFGRIYGELTSPILIAGAFGLHNLISENESSKKIAFEILQTTFYAGVITTGLKLALGRARPFTENGSKDFGNWSLLNDSFHSLPSGHVTVAFSISTVLANNSHSTWLKILCYVPAFLTATSRVYQDKHWFSDVLLGGVIGYSVGTWVTSKHESISISGIPSMNRINFVVAF